MRPHRLVIEGFGPFRDRQTVDFDTVSQDGIFLITGPTGAGKTTILDALCFALFNAVPGPRGSAAQLRCQLTAPGDPTRVELEFSIGPRRFRIERTPQYQRPRKRGTGMTTQNHTVALAEHVDGQWAGISRTAQETQAFLDTIIGLTAAQFTKLVVLPQGDFAAFLHADPSERETILEKLFATQHFRAAERVLSDRATQARRETEQAEQQRRSVLETAARFAWEALPAPAARPSIPDTLAQLGVAAVSAQERAEVAGTTARMWADRAAEVERHAGEWARRSEDRAALTALAADERAWELCAPERAELESQVRRARAAQGLRHVLRARDDARATVRLQDAAADTARQQVQRALPDDAALTVEELDPTALAAAHAYLERSADRLARLRDLEEQAQSAQSAVEDAQQAEDAARATQEQREEAAAALRGQVAEDRAEADQLESAASTLESLRQTQRRLAAVTTAQAQHDAAHERVLAASQHAESTALALRSLRAAVRADAAGQLAAGLMEDEPCPVCGSAAHPHPAAPVDDGPAPQEVEAAETADVRAREELAAARAALSAAAATLAAARDEAGDADPAAIAQQLQEAQAAGSRRTVLRTAIASAESRLHDVEETLRTARTDALRLREDRTRAETRLTQVRSTLAEARQSQADAAPDQLSGLGFSVPTTAEDSRAQAEAADALRTAHGRWATASAAARTAQEDETARQSDLTTALAESEFADETALAESARLSLEQLEAQQREHGTHAARLALRRESEAIARAHADRATDEQLQEATARAQERAISIRAQADGAAERAVLARDRLGTAQEALRRAAADQEADRARVDDLLHDIDIAELVLGTSSEAASRMSLSSYALSALFEEVAHHATERLVDMTAGRYRLQHDLERRRGEKRAGLGLRIVDTFTDEARDPRTLSGGESFMASLALALGMADTIRGETGGIDLDALFLDEGFGTLDPDTLSDVLAVLDRLRTGGRTIGIISHVSELQQAIPTRIAVEPGPRGATIRASGARPDPAG